MVANLVVAGVDKLAKATAVAIAAASALNPALGPDRKTEAIKAEIGAQATLVSRGVHLQKEGGHQSISSGQVSTLPLPRQSSSSPS